MKRIILAVLILVVAVSGCVNNSETPENSEATNFSDNPGEVPDDSQVVDNSSTDSEGFEKADVRTVDFTSNRDQVVNGGNMTLTVSVENKGGAPGHYEEGIEVAREAGGYDDFSLLEEINTTELGSDEGTNISKTFRMETVGTYKYRIDEYNGGDFNTSVKVVPRNLSLRESYINTRPVKMTVESFELMDSYEGEDGEVTPEKEYSQQFLFMKYRAENMGSENVSALDYFQLNAWTDGEKFDETWHAEDAVNYDPFQDEDYDARYNYLRPGEVREGYLSYQIPKTSTRDDITFKWAGEVGLQRPVVYWHR